jgi:hypothetical protein
MVNTWAPLKIHISSLPRRREPSQINKLDSRLRGNDELLEVPTCKDINWAIKYLQLTIPKLNAHDAINQAVTNFLVSLQQIKPDKTAVSFLIGKGNNVLGRKKSPVVLEFIRQFEDALLLTFPSGSPIRFGLALRGCYLPISNHFYLNSTQRVLISYQQDQQLRLGSVNRSSSVEFDIPIQEAIDLIYKDDELHQTARDRIHHLSELFVSYERGLGSNIENDFSDLFMKDLNSLRIVSEILSAISQLGEDPHHLRSPVFPKGRAKVSCRCDICFRLSSPGSIYCNIHSLKSGENNAYRRDSKKKLVRYLPSDFDFCSDDPEALYKALPAKAKNRDIKRALFNQGLIEREDINLINYWADQIDSQPWSIASDIWWTIFQVGLPYTFQKISQHTMSCLNWEDTVDGIWNDLENSGDCKDSDIVIFTLIEAEVWFESIAGYSPKVIEKPTNTAEIIRMRKEGIKQSEIAKRLGCSRSFVSKITKRMDL